jgi:hypothetical protein
LHSPQPHVLSIRNPSLRINPRGVASLPQRPLTLERAIPKTPAVGMHRIGFLRRQRPESTRGKRVQPKPPSTGRATPCPGATMLRPKVATPGPPEIDLESRLDSLVENVSGKVGEDPVGHAKTPR